jgi:RsiW-degrading membrane proteinase PrsW (M82 family)
MHALCGVMMGFLITLSIFEKKHNYLNLFLAILIPVGMHGLYNYSLGSKVVSYHMANVILFVFFLRAIYLFRDMKQRQKKGKLFHKKHYTITVNNFIQASTSVLLIYLGLNYLVSITF